MQNMHCDENLDVRENVLLAPYTSWKIGGAARYFCDIDAEKVADAIAWANTKGIPFCVMGGGSNILVPSGGLDALVIRLNSASAFCNVSENSIEASAALPLGRLVSEAKKSGRAGFDFLAGIPGTVGGAVFMNAGTGGESKREICDIFISAKILRAGVVLCDFSISDMEFSHRRSVLQSGNSVLLAATFKADVREESESIAKKIEARIAERRAREPENNKNAGSVFKAAGGIPAAVYIDKAGLKGLREGGAMVSLKHANWIENLGGATSSDVLSLMEKIRASVSEKFGVELIPEVRVLGAGI